MPTDLSVASCCASLKGRACADAGGIGPGAELKLSPGSQPTVRAPSLLCPGRWGDCGRPATCLKCMGGGSGTGGSRPGWCLRAPPRLLFPGADCLPGRRLPESRGCLPRRFLESSPHTYPGGQAQGWSPTPTLCAHPTLPRVRIWGVGTPA